MSDPITRLNAALEGRYRIERQLGEGGMATVYLARDEKHNRNVALKVLKPELANAVGADRFLSEIETTANLQHPFILPLFDSGEADGFLFYVMPHMEGESLRQRLDREHQLPVDEAVEIAESVAEALDFAHSRGIVHRDIKPGNILFQQGEPAISDFGIALALSHDGAGRLTETSLSPGTPYYMSPEQATGDLSVGPTADIYALGCVLYEMLVGEPPYTGSTPQAVLGKIITHDAPSARDARRTVPPNVDATIRKAIEKVPADRFATAKDFVRALNDPGFRHSLEPARVTTGARGSRWTTAALAILAGLGLAGLGWATLRANSAADVTRVSVRIPENQALHPVRGDLDLSDDGSLLVYRGMDQSGQSQLWARRWDRLEADVIPGTEDGNHPTISPDGLQLAFGISAGTEIRIVSLEGGIPRTLVRGGNTPEWSPDGEWIFFRGSTGGIHRIPADGGEEEVVTRPDSAQGELRHSHLRVLPGGRKIVYQTVTSEGSFIAATDVDDGSIKLLTPGIYPRYSPTGHLLFVDEGGTLMAARIDIQDLELTGGTWPVATGLALDPAAMGFFDVSDTGRLVYLAMSAGETVVTPVFVDRDGQATRLDDEWRLVGDPANLAVSLSPEGRRLAVSSLGAGGTYDIWIRDLDEGPPTRLTFDGRTNTRPTWAPDGQSLIFISDRAGLPDLWSKRSDGSGAATSTLDWDQPVYTGLLSPDRSWLIFSALGAANDTGLYNSIYAVWNGPGEAELSSGLGDVRGTSPALSPDGRFLAYQSDERGRNEVYVQPFPNTDGSRWTVSNEGGTVPRWARSGDELFYRNSADELVAVEVRTDPSFATLSQRVLFSVEGYLSRGARVEYDVAPDDQGFIMLETLGDDSSNRAELILVDNWFQDLERVPN